MNECLHWLILLSSMPGVDADRFGVRVAAQSRFHVGGYRAVLLARLARPTPEWVRLRRRIATVPAWEPRDMPSLAVLAYEWSGERYEFDTRRRLGRIAFLYYQQQLDHDMPFSRRTHYDAGRRATYDLAHDLLRMGVPEAAVNAGVYTLRFMRWMNGFGADYSGEGY